ncbi:hypothetical protein MMC21_003239, partial [Puttea exsequens]|nr:hypothetical protein [Puttea exsequens]
MTTAIKITALTCLLAAPQALASAPISINPDVLKNIHKIFPLEPSFNIRDPILTNNLNLTLHLPTDAVLAATATFEDRSTNYLKQSMPDTLKQFNVPADQIQAKVDKGTPLIVEAIKELLTQDHDAASHGLQTRSFFGDLLDWAEGAGCALVAATGFGVYMLAAANYKAANAGIP